jgi:hypothetical protein
VLNWRGQRGDKQAVAIVRLDFISSKTEALISKVFKRPVLWDHRIKDYHNRDFVDKERRSLSQTLNINSKYYYIAFVFGLYTNLCAEVATSEIHDPALTAHLRAPKRKRGKSTQSYQEEMISLENKKLERLIKHEENDEDLNFFRSQFQTLVADEIIALQNNLLHLQSQVWTLLVAVGLQNRICTSVMPRIISRIILLQLFLRVCSCRDHRY